MDLSPQIFQQKESRLTLLSRVHFFAEEESDSKHVQFFTQHYCGKLGLSIEVEFLSETKPGFISSPKSKFRDQNQIFWLGITLRKLNPNMPLNETTSSTETQLQI